MQRWVISSFEFGYKDGDYGCYHYVRGFLPSRKKSSYVSEYLENLYALLRENPKSQIELTKQNKYSARDKTKLVGDVSCSIGTNPFILFAEKSNILEISNEEPNKIKWERLGYTKVTSNVPLKLEDIPSEIKEAEFFNLLTSYS